MEYNGFMFSGGYNNSIDDRGRAIIPSKFRQSLGKECKLVKGFDGCLYLFPINSWQKYKENHIDNRPDEDENARKLKRLFNYNSLDVEVDSQGRISVPANYREYASIQKEMVNIGNSDRIEIWSKERFEQEVEPDSQKLDEIFSTMKQYIG
jgi:MraZ protein